MHTDPLTLCMNWDALTLNSSGGGYTEMLDSKKFMKGSCTDLLMYTQFHISREVSIR